MLSANGRRECCCTSRVALASHAGRSASKARWRTGIGAGTNRRRRPRARRARGHSRRTRGTGVPLTGSTAMSVIAPCGDETRRRAIDPLASTWPSRAGKPTWANHIPPASSDASANGASSRPARTPAACRPARSGAGGCSPSRRPRPRRRTPAASRAAATARGRRAAPAARWSGRSAPSRAASMLSPNDHSVPSGPVAITSPSGALNSGRVTAPAASERSTKLPGREPRRPSGPSAARSSVSGSPTAAVRNVRSGDHARSRRRRGAGRAPTRRRRERRSRRPAWSPSATCSTSAAPTARRAKGEPRQHEHRDS